MPEFLTLPTEAQALANLIHDAVKASDLNGGTLSPLAVYRALKPAFPNLSQEDGCRALYEASDYRGGCLPV